MKIKTSELIGAALDWTVASLLGQDYFQPDYEASQLNYSSDWAYGGPIIERERLWLQPEIGKENTAGAWYCVAISDNAAYGPTPLIAAMRCYVASQLGDEVELPDELPDEGRTPMQELGDFMAYGPKKGE
jgi:hypothetical protein